VLLKNLVKKIILYRIFIKILVQNYIFIEEKMIMYFSIKIKQKAVILKKNQLNPDNCLILKIQIIVKSYSYI